MAACDTRQLSQAQREEGFTQNRTGVQQAVRPFTGAPTAENLADYINRELFPAVKATRKAANDIYLQVADNAPSANPLGYYFSTETAGGDPTEGRVRVNATPQSSSTNIAISQTNARLVDVLPWLTVMNGSVTEPLGVVTLADAINPGRFLRADLDTMVDQGAYWDLGITITEASHPDPFVDSEGVTLAFIPGVADNGGLGAQIPPGSISPIATDTFLGNISGSTAAPVAVPLADIDSTSIVYDGTAHQFQRPALTGDVAAPQNSNATTIQPDVVDNTKLANMAQATIKGRASGAGTGDPTDLTGAQVATIAGGWPGVLAAGATTGANNPQIDAAQYVQFGSGTVPASGQLRSSATILARSTAAVQLIGGTGISATATTGALALAASAGAASLTATGAGNNASLISSNNAVVISAGGAISGTAATSIGLTASAGISLTTSGVSNIALSSTSNAVTINAGTVINHSTGGALRLSMSANGSWAIGGTAGTTGQALVSAGASAPPAWGAIALTALPSIADDTFLANISGASAAPTAVALTTLAGAGLTGGADAILAVGAGTGITVNANDVAVTIPLTDGDKGDITVASSGTAWTIDANAVTTAKILDANVTLAKLANLAAGTVIGRQIDAGTGVPVALTGAEVGESIRFAETHDVTLAAGTYNDVALDARVKIVYIDASGGDVIITGFALSGGNTGGTFRLSNYFSGRTILRHATGSAAGNQILTPGSVDYILADDFDSVLIQFVAARGFWTVVDRRGTGQWIEIEETGAGPFNDFDPGVDSLAHVMSSNTAATFNGVRGAILAGNQLLVSHQGTGTTTLTHNNVSSGASTRFFNNAAGSSVILSDNQCAFYICIDETAGAGLSLRWQLVSVSSPTAGASASVVQGTDGTYQRAALTGAITAAQNSNATLFDTNASGAGLTGGGTAILAVGAGTHVTVNANDVAVNVTTLLAAIDSTSIVVNSGTLERAALTGDVTSAQNSNVTVIADNTVGNGQLVNMAQGTIKGRANGAGTGDPQDLTPTQVISIIDGESPTWTGVHTFTGTNFAVDVSDGYTLESVNTSVITGGDRLILTAGTSIDLNSPHQLNSLSAFTGVQTVATAGAINNLVLTGNVLRLTGAAWSLTGMVPWRDGAMVLIINASAIVGTLQGEDGGSTATNRFAGIDHVLNTGQASLAWYDGTLDRWCKH